MQLDELDHSEKLVFLALYHWMIHADGEVTEAEQAALVDVARRVADPDWKGLLSEARLEYPDSRAIRLGARRLARPEVRQLIYNELLQLAASDEYHLAEVELLDWLAGVWGFLPDE